MRDSILKRVASGEIDAMERCIERYGRLVWSIAGRLGASASDGDDAVQEVFASIWINAWRFDPDRASEVTFVSMIARQRIIDHLRKRASRARVESDERVRASSPVVPLEPRVESDRIHRALDKLSPDQQRVLRLAVQFDLTREEIARHTGFPVNTVKSHLRRGLVRLRDELGVWTSESAREMA